MLGTMWIRDSTEVTRVGRTVRKKLPRATEDPPLQVSDIFGVTDLVISNVSALVEAMELWVLYKILK